MPRLESAIQSEIITKLKAQYKKGFVYKHPPSPTGIPDIHFILKGVSYWFEVKRTSKEEPSPIQKLRHKHLKKAGCIVGVVWDWKQVDYILQESQSYRGTSHERSSRHTKGRVYRFKTSEGLL